MWTKKRKRADGQCTGSRQPIADTDNQLSSFRHEIDKGIVTSVNERPPERAVDNSQREIVLFSTAKASASNREQKGSQQ